MSSPGGIVGSLLGIAFLLPLGVVTVFQGCGVVFLLGALILAAMSAWDLSSYLRHPVVREPS
jgi:hypothetical protein